MLLSPSAHPLCSPAALKSSARVLFSSRSPSHQTEPTGECDPALICSPAHGGLGASVPLRAAPDGGEPPPASWPLWLPASSSARGSHPPARATSSRTRRPSSTSGAEPEPGLLELQQPALLNRPAGAGGRPPLCAGARRLAGPGHGRCYPSSPANQQASPVIHYSPTNQPLRHGSHQEFQLCPCTARAAPGPARPGPPCQSGSEAEPGSYPTVIQQQNAPSQRRQKADPRSVTKGSVAGRDDQTGAELGPDLLG